LKGSKYIIQMNEAILRFVIRIQIGENESASQINNRMREISRLVTYECAKENVVGGRTARNAFHTRQDHEQAKCQAERQPHCPVLCANPSGTALFTAQRILALFGSRGIPGIVPHKAVQALVGDEEPDGPECHKQLQRQDGIDFPNKGWGGGESTGVWNRTNQGYWRSMAYGLAPTSHKTIT
jgi:hypothetical protein